MTQVELATKTCSRCGEVKPLSAFWKQKNGPMGRYSSCKKCTRPGIDAAQARRREILGEEEYKRVQRLTVAKSRATGGADYRSIKARNNAYLELARRHKDELEAIVRIERARLGLNPDSQRARTE